MIPKISIVTPSYNQGKYIENTIKSVINQKYPNFEYFIIDGGSTDNTVEIIKKYEKHITHWKSEKDNGQSHAINKGLKMCTGDIVAWINSDDIYIPGTFKYISDFFIKNPNIDMIYGNAKIVNENRKLLFHRKEIPFSRVYGCLFGFGDIIPQPSAFWRSDLFNKIGYLDEERQYNMDSEFWGRIAFVGKIKHINKCFSEILFHSSAKTVINIKSQTNKQKEEFISRGIKYYKKLKISKIIPFKYTFLLKWIFRIKRIIIRFFYGHYFKNYFTRFNIELS